MTTLKMADRKSIVAGIAAPQLASTTMGFGFLSSMGFVYNRGTPPIARDDAGGERARASE